MPEHAHRDARCDESVTSGICVFGYGSLVFRPDFPHRESAPAYVQGYARRFWQGSTDHRGVPGAPGRVVTLIDAPDAPCWGRLFWVAPDDVEAVLTGLDHREKNGYERARVTAQRSMGGLVHDVLMYRATPDNPEFLGDAPFDDLVAQIAASSGPSGDNREYVLRLADALMEIVPAESRHHDAHVFALAAALRGEAR